MSDRTMLLFSDSAGNTYNEAQVVLEEKDGRKIFTTGNGGSEVTPIGVDATSDEAWDIIKHDRDAAKAAVKPDSKTQLPGDK